MSQVISFTNYTPAARFDDVPWEQVTVEEGTTSSGPWTSIDTLTLSPLDADPADPQARNLTTDNASDTADLWYRITFVDGNGGTGQPSDPIQNAAPFVGFVTSNDLAMRLGETFTDEEAARADALLADAFGLIQDETRQKIILVEDDVLSLSGTTDDRIALPEKPVVSIASITLNQQPLTEGHDWFLKGNEIIRISSLYTRGIGMLDGPFLLGGPGVGFGFPNQQIVITYTHGYTDDEIPQTVKSICIEAAVRCIVNPGAVARETVGNTSTVYDNNRFAPTGLLLNDDERRKLRRIFGVRARSIQIGG